MAFLCRAVARAKWEGKPLLSPSEIAADAVTGDLRTTDNTLSFWKMRPDNQLEMVALAIASAREKPETLDIVWVPTEALQKDGIEVIDAPATARTAATRYKSFHVDAIRLDLERLSDLARVVASAVRKQDCKRFTKAQIVSLLKDGLQSGVLDRGKLDDRLRTELEKAT